MEDIIRGHNEQVRYTVLAKYTISTNGERVVLSRELSGTEITYGNNNLGRFFDQWNVRRKAYGVSRADLMAIENNFTNNLDNVKGREKVRIYKQKKQKRKY